MKGASRLFFTMAVVFVLIGMGLGLRMGISGIHDQIPTHAHIMLVGWVTSALIGYFYHLFPAAGNSGLAMLHFFLHFIGAVVMSVALWFVFSGNLAFEPGAGIGAIVVLIGMLLFTYLSLREIWKA